ncbi:hypothetical protein O1V64_10860 [Rouxiella badensis]|nr:hypothetical protein O1V64_10860 [Rouxiella badensis]
MTTTSNASSLDGYLGHFEEMKSVHTQEMLKLNDIGQALARCKKDLEATQEKSKEDETSWRSRFRSLRGEITNDMKQEHTQRIVQRELAEEYRALIDELELDQQSAMLSCCTSGKNYINAYNTAFVAYADSQWNAAMRSLSPTLVRAIKLKRMALSISGLGNENQPGYIEPETAIKQLLGGKLAHAAESAVIDIKGEPVLERIGLRRPALTGVDMNVFGLGLAGKMKLGAELRAKREALSKGRK